MSKRHLFSLAWEMARNAADAHGGIAKEYFAEALRYQWDRWRSDPRQAHRFATVVEGAGSLRSDPLQGGNLASAAARARSRMGTLYSKTW